MKLNRVTAVYFSPTQTSKTGAETIAQAILPQAEHVDLTRFDAPLPDAFGPMNWWCLAPRSMPAVCMKAVPNGLPSCGGTIRPASLR